MDEGRTVSNAKKKEGALWNPAWQKFYIFSMRISSRPGRHNDNSVGLIYIISANFQFSISVLGRGGINFEQRQRQNIIII